MRYTTIIDITEVPEVYRNHNARLIYLHLTLKSGYRDNDRDMIKISIRNLAMRTGMSVSATRHALSILTKHNLLSRAGETWIVKKWIIEDTITPRAKTKKQQRAQDAAQVQREQQAERERREEQERRYRTELEKAGKTSFMVYYEGLLRKAKDGDQEAQAKVDKYREDYENQKKMMSKNSIK
jgi:membrane-bound lytic murein transglycosylase